MKYVKTNQIQNKEIQNYIIKKYKMPISLADYIINLGYSTPDEVDQYLNPSFNLFYDPYDFKDMKAVVDKINQAIKENKRILIFGDYDVDGIGSTYILIKYFEELGIRVDYFLPSRYQDGYGLTCESVDKIKELFDPELIITVDCGIASVKEVEYIKSLGMDIIITDHHEPQETLPDCLILDCKMPKEKYPFKYLCGAGMALKLVYALSDFETCKKYFTVCAISTISDIVELVGENRYIVQEGLKNFKKDCPKGLAYLIKQCKITNIPTSKDISFRVSPKLNATGRMGDASISLKLYLANNNDEIKSLYSQIIEMNSKRQNLCDDICFQAMQMIEGDSSSKNIVILKDRNWECGVLGIVCSKLMEKLHKPIILLGYDERLDIYTGSARSIGNCDLFSAISVQSDLLEKFGGHKNACGLSLKLDNFEIFKNNMVKCFNEENMNIKNEKYYDIEKDLDSITFDYMKKLQLLEPFGVSNPEPIFMSKIQSLTTSPMNNHFEHLVIEGKNYSGVFFGKSKSIYTLSFNAQKEIYFTAFIDYFLNKSSIKINILDFYCQEYKKFNAQISQGLQINHFISSDMSTCAKYRSLSEYNENMSNNVVYIVYNSDEIAYNYNEVNYVHLSSKDANQVLLVSPIDFEFSPQVQRVVFLEPIRDLSILIYINSNYPNIEVYADVQPFKEIKINRNKINQMQNLLKDIKGLIFDEIYMYKKFISKFGIQFKDFIICLNILASNSIIEYDKSSFQFKFLCDDVCADCSNIKNLDNVILE